MGVLTVVWKLLTDRIGNIIPEQTETITGDLL